MTIDEAWQDTPALSVISDAVGVVYLLSFLHSPDEGYLTLSYDDGGWSLDDSDLAHRFSTMLCGRAWTGHDLTDIV